MVDSATCPECNKTFNVTRYGRKVPCPHCDEALDIAPDPLPPMPQFTAQDWQRAVRAKIEYLGDLERELRDTQIPGADGYIARIREEVTLLGSLCGGGNNP